MGTKTRMAWDPVLIDPMSGGVAGFVSSAWGTAGTGPPPRRAPSSSTANGLGDGPGRHWELCLQEGEEALQVDHSLGVAPGDAQVIRGCLQAPRDTAMQSFYSSQGHTALGVFPAKALGFQCAI